MQIFTKVVGVTFDNPDGTNRQHLIASLNDNSQIFIKRDYANFYDPNAIMVMNFQGQQIGYVSRDVASQLAPQMDSGKEIYAKIACLTGGGTYTFGVNIKIYD